MVKTSPSHGEIRSSTLLEGAKEHVKDVFLFYLSFNYLLIITMFTRRKNKTDIYAKAVADTIVRSMDITAHDEILVVASDDVLSLILQKYSASVQTVASLIALEGGTYDYIFIYDLPYDKAREELAAALSHLEFDGKAVVLNTNNKLSENEIKKVAALGNPDTAIVNDEFSLAVIR